MSETLEAPKAPTVEQNQRGFTIADNRLAETMFNDAPPVQRTEAQPAEAAPATPKPDAQTNIAVPAATTVKADEEIVEPNEFLKKNFGWDNEEAAKKEIEELRKLKTQAPAEIKYENEDSKKIFDAIVAGKEDEVFEILSQKRQIAKINSLDVSKPADAAEIIKLSLQLKHKTLEPYEIADLFNEQYEKAAKPKEDDYATTDEYQAALTGWQTRMDAIDKKMVRDAKIAKPDIEQFNSKIVLPQIPKQDNQVAAPTQEELDKAKKFDEFYIQSLENSMKEFSGFSVSAHLEDAGLQEIPISYGITDTEKTSLAQQLNDFVKTGYNANALFAQRWVNEDNSIKTGQMIRDLSLLNNADKVFQKIANDAASKGVDAYIKSKKQINVTGTTAPVIPLTDDKNEMDKVRDSFFG